MSKSQFHTLLCFAFLNPRHALAKQILFELILNKFHLRSPAGIASSSCTTSHHVSMFSDTPRDRVHLKLNDKCRINIILNNGSIQEPQSLIVCSDCLCSSPRRASNSFLFEWTDRQDSSHRDCIKSKHVLAAPLLPLSGTCLVFSHCIPSVERRDCETRSIKLEVFCSSFRQQILPHLIVWRTQSHIAP